MSILTMEVAGSKTLSTVEHPKLEAHEATIPLRLIKDDGGTQMRAEINNDIVAEYRDKWLAGVEFDLVDVFYDGSVYWLADGFHRFYGAREANLENIRCRVHHCTLRDAILFATGANSDHGLRRTNDDKRIAVQKLLGDEEWVKWSDNKIAEQAAVSVQFVANVRRELSTVDSSPAARTANEPRVGRDGKKRKARRRPMKDPATGDTSKQGEPGEQSEHIQPDIILDKDGNPLPDRPALRRAFESRELFFSAHRAYEALFGNVHKIAGMIPDGEIFKGKLVKFMKPIFEALQQHEPAYVCDACNGGGCQQCQKRGYITTAAFPRRVAG